MGEVVNVNVKVNVKVDELEGEKVGRAACPDAASLAIFG